MLLSSTNRGAAIVVAMTLAVSPVLQALPQSAPAAQPKPAGAKPTTTTAKPAAATAQTVADLGWPRTYTTSSQGRVVIYEPQISGWADQKRLVAHAAASYQAKATTPDAKPALGTIKVEADTRVSLDERLVNFARMRITESNFPSLPKEQLREVSDEIAQAIPEEDRVIALDRVLAFIDKSAILPTDVPGLKADPPVIFYSTTPAVIVNFDGDPIWSPIEKNDLKFAVNTNWDVFEHGPTKTYYLRYNQGWLTSTNLSGQWTPAGKLARQLYGASCFRELQGGQSGRARKAVAGQRPSCRQGQLRPCGADSAARRAELPARHGSQGTALGVQHRERCLPSREDRTGLLPRRRALVLRPGLHRTVDVCDAEAARGLQAHSARTRTVARAGVGAWHRPGDRCVAAGAGAADRARQQNPDSSP